MFPFNRVEQKNSLEHQAIAMDRYCYGSMTQVLNANAHPHDTNNYVKTIGSRPPNIICQNAIAKKGVPMIHVKAIQSKLFKAATMLLPLVLVACATATPYQPEFAGKRVSGGYSETRHGQDRYTVHFSGNTMTSRETVEGYLLYRAAEITVQNGYDWFRITDHTTERDRRTYIERSPRYEPWYGSGYYDWRPHWRYYRRGGWTTWHPYGGDPFWHRDEYVRTIERFEAEAEIIMHRGPMRTDQTRAFDARKVMNDMGPTIKRPDGE